MLSVESLLARELMNGLFSIAAGGGSFVRRFLFGSGSFLFFLPKSSQVGEWHIDELSDSFSSSAAKATIFRFDDSCAVAAFCIEGSVFLSGLLVVSFCGDILTSDSLAADRSGMRLIRFFGDWVCIDRGGSVKSFTVDILRSSDCDRGWEESRRRLSRAEVLEELDDEFCDAGETPRRPGVGDRLGECSCILSIYLQK